MHTAARSGCGRLSNGRVAIVGIGNVLMGDDGIGVRAVEALRDRPLPTGVDLHDAGTAVQDLVPDLAEYDQVIVVDAVRTGGEPGVVHRFDIRSDTIAGEDPRWSLHDMNLITALRLQQVAGEATPPIRVIGVEPKQVRPSLELSEEVRARLPQVTALVVEEAQNAVRT